MPNRAIGVPFAFFLGLFLVFTATAWGESEIFGFGGFATTNSYIRTSGTTFGATAGVYVGKHVQFFGEYSRVPLPPGGNFLLTTSTRRYDNFGGGIHVRFLVGKSIQPYVLVPVGAGRRTTSGGADRYDPDRTDLYFGAGAGVRLYAGRNWGFRPEYRLVGYVHPSDILLDTPSFQVFTIAFFYQFRRH
jgi:hypothetical protein